MENWLKKAGINDIDAGNYARFFMNANLKSIKKVAKAVENDGDQVLEDLGVEQDDVGDIVNAMRNFGLLTTAPQAEEKKEALPENTPDKASDVIHRRGPSSPDSFLRMTRKFDEFEQVTPT
jgi:hypothetical protein